MLLQHRDFISAITPGIGVLSGAFNRHLSLLRHAGGPRKDGQILRFLCEDRIIGDRSEKRLMA